MRLLSVSLLTIFLLVSCEQEQTAERRGLGTDTGSDVVQYEPELEKVTAVLSPTEESQTAGVVVFTMTDQGIRVEATVTGLDSESRHGFHIHEFGDCRAPDATSAGGHYNPTDEEHGAPSDDLRHMGDLGNLPADAQGTASVDFLDAKLELNGPNSILGRAVIVHAGTDDFQSQPTGNAGSRLACGVIGVANPNVTLTQ